MRSQIRNAVVVTVAGFAFLAGAVACSGSATPDDPATHTTAATRTPTAKPSTDRPTATPTTARPTSKTPTPKPVSAEQRNANGTASDYLETQHFSRKGLIAQLKYEGYSTKVSTTAVDSLHANWDSQAAGTAGDYLDNQHFSRSSLIAQLEYDGYSHSQAVYGVSKAGL